MTKEKEKENRQEKKDSPAEKPISLWGAPFVEVVKALLDTKPIPKEEEKEKDAKRKKAQE